MSTPTLPSNNRRVVIPDIKPYWKFAQDPTSEGKHIVQIHGNKLGVAAPVAFHDKQVTFLNKNGLESRSHEHGKMVNHFKAAIENKYAQKYGSNFLKPIFASKEFSEMEQKGLSHHLVSQVRKKIDQKIRIAEQKVPLPGQDKIDALKNKLATFNKKILINDEVKKIKAAISEQYKKQGPVFLKSIFDSEEFKKIEQEGCRDDLVSQLHKKISNAQLQKNFAEDLKTLQRDGKIASARELSKDDLEIRDAKFKKNLAADYSNQIEAVLDNNAKLVEMPVLLYLEDCWQKAEKACQQLAFSKETLTSPIKANEYIEEAKKQAQRAKEIMSILERAAGFFLSLDSNQTKKLNDILERGQSFFRGAFDAAQEAVEIVDRNHRVLEGPSVKFQHAKDLERDDEGNGTWKEIPDEEIPDAVVISEDDQKKLNELKAAHARVFTKLDKTKKK